MADAAIMQSLIYNATADEDRVEHFRVRARRQAIDILAFVDTSNAEEALTKLYNLVDRTLARNPQLSNWRII